MKYLICSDLDDTLLYPDKTISNYSMQKIKELTDSGELFVLVTGRPYAGIANYVDTLDINNPFICDNGGSIFIPNKSGYDRITFAIDLNTFLHLYEEIKGLLYAFIDTNYKNVYTTNLSLIPDFLVHKELDDIIIHEGPLEEILQEDLILPNIWIKEDDIDTFNQILDKYKDKIGYRYWGVWDKLASYELYSINSSKEKAILYLQDLYKIEEKNTYAFGDAQNDLPMLVSKKIKGIAMKNASDEIKMLSYDVTDYPFNEDGLVKYLIKLGIVKK